MIHHKYFHQYSQMSAHFIKIPVKEVRKETEDCVSIAFDIPGELKEAFLYSQGQNITVRMFHEGEEIRRSYSLCSAPFENEFRVAIKKTEGGIFSVYANERLRAGDELELMPPSGRFFTPIDPAREGRYVFFAAGSGITPVISIIKTILRSEPGSECTLVFGNRTRQSIIFREEIEGLKNRYMNRFRVIHVLSRERTDYDINAGRIDDTKLEQLSKLIDFNHVDEAFICGPETLIFTVRDFLEAHGVNKKNIHFELFTTPGQRQSTAKKTESAVETGPRSHVTIRLDGRSIDFDLSFSGDSILDAALRQGADLPYACKGGVCCTCRAKLVEGEVNMDVNYSLEQDEIEAGFILTCQSHPVTERIVIDYDIK